jgi:hypothetical protein
MKNGVQEKHGKVKKQMRVPSALPFLCPLAEKCRTFVLAILSLIGHRKFKSEDLMKKEKKQNERQKIK